MLAHDCHVSRRINRVRLRFPVARNRHGGGSPPLLRCLVDSYAGRTSEAEIAGVTRGTVATGQAPTDVLGSRAATGNPQAAKTDARRSGLARKAADTPYGV